MNSIKKIHYIIFIQFLFSRVVAAQILTELTKIQSAFIKEIVAHNSLTTNYLNWTYVLFLLLMKKITHWKIHLILYLQKAIQLKFCLIRK